MSGKAEITFYANAEIRAILSRWAKEEDRSVSNVLRRLILAEEERRRANEEAKKRHIEQREHVKKQLGIR